MILKASKVINDNRTSSKLYGITLFGIIYLLAYILGFMLGRLSQQFLWEMLVFDLSATVVIWVGSLFLRNSSLYDPYWSLTPLVMVGYGILRFHSGLNVFHYIFFASFALWSIRLTGNWIITFDGIHWEDWRYRKYRELPPMLWHIANFFGIMIVPTLFVFAGMVPVFYFFTVRATARSLIGTALVLFGTSLEFFADRQIHHHLRSADKMQTCREGLWKYSRHPNYLGEILIWVGAYLALVCTAPGYWYLFGGVVAMIFLFLVISIPMAEKRQLSRRPDYQDYRKKTAMLLLLPLWK